VKETTGSQGLEIYITIKRAQHNADYPKLVSSDVEATQSQLDINCLESKKDL